MIYTVILWYSFVVESPPPPCGGEPSRHWWGDYKGGKVLVHEAAALYHINFTISAPPPTLCCLCSTLPLLGIVCAACFELNEHWLEVLRRGHPVSCY